MQSFNVDMVVVTKHTIIRPTGKDIRRHARKSLLICLKKKTFHFFIVQKLGAVKTKFNCQRHELICSMPTPKLKQSYLCKKEFSKLANLKIHLTIHTKVKTEKALKKPESTCFYVNNELPSMVLNEIDRLADVEVDVSTLSDIETHSYPTCVEIQRENHSSSDLKPIVSDLTNSLSPLPDQNNHDETEQNNDSITTKQSAKYSVQVVEAVKKHIKKLIRYSRYGA